MARVSLNKKVAAAVVGAQLVGVGACSLFVDTSGLSGGNAGAADANAFDSSGTDASNDATLGDAATTYFAAVMSDSPVAYWRLDETVGPTIKDQTGKFPGTIRGAVTLGVAGALSDDTAASFDGTTAFVDFGDVLDFPGGKPFSVEAWINPSYVDAGIQDVLSKIGYSTAFDGYSMAFNEQFHFYMCTNEQAPCLSALTSPPQASRFTHVVSTFDGSTARIFFDGALANAQSLPGKNLIDNPYTFLIGSEQGTGFFSGTIDEVAVYDHALTIDRIQAHFEARK
jgi:hypothetical protein